MAVVAVVAVVAAAATGGSSTCHATLEGSFSDGRGMTTILNIFATELIW